MRFATIARINEDSTVNLRSADGSEIDSAAILHSYSPVQFEQVVVVEVDGEPVVLGSLYNRASELGIAEE